MSSDEKSVLEKTADDAFRQLMDLERINAEQRQLYNDDRTHIVNSFCDDVIKHNNGVVDDFSYFAFAMHGDTSVLPPRVLREFGGIVSKSQAKGFTTVRDRHQELRSKFRADQWRPTPLARTVTRMTMTPSVSLPQIVEVAVIPQSASTYENNLVYRVQRSIDRREVSGTVRHGYVGTIELPVDQAIDVRDFDGTEEPPEGQSKNIVLTRVERLIGSLATRSEVVDGLYQVGIEQIMNARRLGHYNEAAQDIIFIKRAQLALELAMSLDMKD